MRTPDERCTGDHVHCNHMDDEDKHFFKVMIDDFRETMSIPDQFVQHFRGAIPRTIKLESRSGYTFDVQITKKLNKLILQSGWESFVSAHDLNMGDFLVFKYKGNLVLHVLIFDPSGCEKSTSYSVKNGIVHVGQEPADVSSFHEHPTKSPQNGNKHWKQHVRSSKGNKIVNISSATTPSMFSGHMLSSEDAETHILPSCILPLRACLTEVQEKKMKEMAQAIRPKTPFYGHVMTKCNVIGIPCLVEIRRCPDAYFPCMDQRLLLWNNGRSWEVQLHIYKGNRKVFYNGWAKFADDNNLQIGDLCLFEPLDKNYTMNVHIIRKG